MRLRPLAAGMTSMFCGSLPIGWVVMSGPDQRRKRFEKAVKTHHQILRSEPVTFSYRPTPPSGPAPEPAATQEPAERKTGNPERKQGAKAD